MSKAIIRPSTTPSRTALEPLMLVEAVVELVHQPADRLAEDHDHHQARDDAGEQRDDQHRHQAAGPGRHLPARRSTCAMTPARTPPMMAPRKPVAGKAARGRRRRDVEDVGGQAAHHEARRDAGPVGDGVGDVARESRDEEHERGLADDEEDGAEVGEEAGAEERVVEAQRVGVGQVEQRVVDDDLAVRDRRSRSRRRGSPGRSAGRRRRRTGSCTRRRSSGCGGSRLPQDSPAPDA